MITPKKNILDYIYENQDWLAEAFMASYDLISFMEDENITVEDISQKTGIDIEVINGIVNQESKIDKEILHSIESAYNTKIFEFEEELENEIV